MKRRAIVDARFGRLVVLERRGQKTLVRCDCGKEKEVWTSNLLGQLKSCGCTRGNPDPPTRAEPFLLQQVWSGVKKEEADVRS